VHNINTQEVRGLGLPLPCLEEQTEIVRRGTAALAIADRLASQLDRTAKTLDGVARALLAKAFRGELSGN
jgi:type I restriction enzyme, S subunit